ncbi:chemotaxis response regulator protein-glutamate methylesterase [Lysinibacillus sp. BW-2-10]|uniref:protein-glutamate methylesterase/protein-glutamine glutaminase n=1 Tax=Lysinibacillus sp. BW-2-10 TaxID=2590030 RepID=UPI00117F0FE8|nr:chemotaxis response regulator protein-glutamate methylesterase [Lysinibacillus sp. BW-2-10]TSI02645.1 chemotaxis response regulator protein-glutamate methylesterase [Lysinibacillus sp. BW-2-10]
MQKVVEVLVVDDSAFMRKTVSALIESFPQFKVIGKARNGVDAIEKTKRLTPDLITLDIEMPELDGLETLKVLMKEHPVPVIMLSSGSESTLEAFELGAVDFVVKESIIKELTEIERENLFERLQAAVNAKLPIPAIKENKEERQKDQPLQHKIIAQKELLFIGSSTGGPAALQTILTNFSADFPIPIVVVQHMPPGFTKPLAERFNGLFHLHVKEAEHNEILLPGTVYIAPAGLQTNIMKNSLGSYQMKLKLSAPIETLYKPSIDVTLLSIAPYIKDKLLAVILTGMGDDGLRGCRLVKEYGGNVLAESEETCVVYGMPKVVHEAGLTDEQASIHQMHELIMNYI